MSNLQLKQAEFMLASGQELVQLRKTMKLNKMHPQATLYMNLCEEEFSELEAAMKKLSESVYETERIAAVSEVADAVCDLAVVMMGLCNSIGIPFHACYDEVHRSNMRKCQEVDGQYKIVKREDGKILKPDTWTPPDLINILRYKLVTGE